MYRNLFHLLSYSPLDLPKSDKINKTKNNSFVPFTSQGW